MRKSSLAAVALVLLVPLALVDCERQAELHSSATPVVDELASTRDQLLQWAERSPYAMTITSSPMSELNGQQWRVEYEGPDRYSLSWTHPGQTSDDTCDDDIATNGETEVCRPVLDPAAPTTTTETIWSGGNPIPPRLHRWAPVRELGDSVRIAIAQARHRHQQRPIS